MYLFRISNQKITFPFYKWQTLPYRFDFTSDKTGIIFSYLYKYAPKTAKYLIIVNIGYTVI